MLLTMVTGASRGIGKAVCTKLAAEGHNVVCLGRDMTSIKKVSEGLPIVNETQRHVAVQCPDFSLLTDSESDSLLKNINSFGNVNCLVHSAGITGKDGIFLKTDLPSLEQVLRVNVMTPLLITRSALRYGGLLRQPSSICFIGSVVGLSGNKGQVSYSTSKAALVGAVKSLSKEYSSKAVRTNMVSPGFIMTDMTSSLPESDKLQIINKTGLQRFGTPEEVAEAVLFTTTSNFLTGQTIQLDGGLVF